MIRQNIYILIVFLAVGCTEIPPELSGNPGEPVNTQKKVLVEEYTGVRCGNCPAGSSLLQTLKQEYGEQLVIVSFHAGFFAKPYPESQQDFKTDQTEALQSHLGEPLGYPAAVVNRKVFDGDFILTANDWAIRIADELNVPYGIGIELATQIENNTLDITVEAALSESFSDELFITLYVVEDNIVDAQATPQTILTDYTHHAILRKIITPVIGEPLNINSSGQQFSKAFSTSLEDHWNLNELSVVAFIHYNGENLEVLQAEEVSLSQ